MSPRAAQLTFLAVGAAHVVFGLALLFAPGPVYDDFATFQPRNDHFIRDFGTFYVALGVAFGAAARRHAWRAPVLVVALVQYALHTANHVYDLGRPAEDWVGPVNAAVVAAALVALALLAYAVIGRRRAP
jgi:hypothetical protein